MRYTFLRDHINCFLTGGADDEWKLRFGFVQQLFLLDMYSVDEWVIKKEMIRRVIDLVTPPIISNLIYLFMLGILNLSGVSFLTYIFVLFVKVPCCWIYTIPY